MNKDNFVLLDIETNVSEGSPMQDHFHVIQLGATKVTNGDFQNPQEFCYEVRPVDVVQYPDGGAILTPFIKNLTHITQEEVDRSQPFPIIWDLFLEFCDPYFEFFASWGDYDHVILKRCCDFYGLKFPFRYHVNLKDYYKVYFAQEENWKMGVGVKTASSFFGLPYDTQGAHNGLVDAKMITAIAEKMVDRGFHTFKKGYYEFRRDQLIPCDKSALLLSPVIVKKYKETKDRARDMERYLLRGLGEQ